MLTGTSDAIRMTAQLDEHFRWTILGILGPGRALAPAPEQRPAQCRKSPSGTAWQPPLTRASRPTRDPHWRLVRRSGMSPFNGCRVTWQGQLGYHGLGFISPHGGALFSRLVYVIPDNLTVSLLRVPYRLSVRGT